jgi:hypothetical protein
MQLKTIQIKETMSTYSLSQSSTYTEGRARYVMGKLFDDFNNILFRGFENNSTEQIKGWRNDVQYVMENDALCHFELQFASANRTWTVRYDVDKSGGISRDDDSGSIDFYSIPSSAKANIVLDYDRKNKDVTAYLESRGWKDGGAFNGENGNLDRAYSKEGFGVNRKLTGTF